MKNPISKAQYFLDTLGAEGYDEDKLLASLSVMKEYILKVTRAKDKITFKDKSIISVYKMGYVVKGVESFVYNLQITSLYFEGQRIGSYKVMAIVDGWVMGRHKGCTPFCCREKDLATRLKNKP